MNKIEVVLDYSLWKKKIKNPKNYFKKKILKINNLKHFKEKSKNFTIFLTNSKKMKDLNKKFRNKNKTADVLSFPFDKKKNINIIYIWEI